MIRTLIMLIFWALAAPVAAIIGFPASFLMGDVRVLYRLFMWGAWAGVWITGVRVETIGLDGFDHSRSYIFMTNHVSNLDPPIQVPLIPRRTSVLVKKELFKVPILGRAMRMGSLVPVDRGNRDAGIEAVRAAKVCHRPRRRQHDHLRRRQALLRRQTSPLQKGPVLSRDGMRRPRNSHHHRGHALHHAESKILHPARQSESNFSCARSNPRISSAAIA